MELPLEKSQENASILIESDPKKKEGRKRRRHLFNAIRDQMEFYFGDANLSKDRYMKQMIEKDPFVPLEIFLNFNKIKALAENKEMLAKALTESELLELDEDKKRVRRKTAIKEITDADDRTIYVEALPSNVDHDWIKNMFARFGKVTYVSLPKYPQSRKPKDFGFVEFQKEKSVLKAISSFKAFNGVLCFEETDPSKLASIKSHNLKTEPEEKNKSVKRLCPEAQDNVKTKKIKLENNSTSTDDENSSSGENKTDSEIKEESCETKNQKKRRKHKKSAEKRKKQLELSTDASFYELKILPKRDWKRLRNKYLNLQRQKAAELKRKAAKERQLQQLKENVTAGNSTETQLIANKSKNEERIKMKMNFYGAGVDTEPPTKQAKLMKCNTESLKPFMKFEKGLIVEIKFEKPCVDIKEFKQEMRQFKAIKYVDIKEGAVEAFLRLENAEEATNFVQNRNCIERKCTVLSGESEASYWEKIERDRQMKRNKEIKIPTKRGREKVKASLAKHIWFGDEDGE